MDLVRAGAIQALIAVAAVHAPAAAAECGALQGTYRYDGISSAADKAALGDMIVGDDRRKIVRVDRPGSSAAFSLSAAQPITRPQTTNLAQRGELVVTPDGTRMRFFDASGKLLVDASLDGLDPYKCDGGRLVRVMERTAGLGDDIRTERIEEVLEVNAKGELVHRESYTVIEGSGKPHKLEERFPRSP